MRLPAGVDVERMEYRMTFDGHLLVLLLLGNADDEDGSGGGCRYRVTTLSVTTLYDRTSCTGDGHQDDDDDDVEFEGSVDEEHKNSHVILVSPDGGAGQARGAIDSLPSMG